MFPIEGSVEVVEQGEKERNSGSREAVGRFLDNWDLGSPGLRPEWLRNEDIRLSPRMSTGNDPEIRQTISNTAKLLSCFTPFGRFGPNILFCQQL